MQKPDSRLSLENELWEIRRELDALSALFEGLGDSSLPSIPVSGLSITFRNFSRRLEAVSDDLFPIKQPERQS